MGFGVSPLSDCLSNVVKRHSPAEFIKLTSDSGKVAPSKEWRFSELVLRRDSR